MNTIYKNGISNDNAVLNIFKDYPKYDERDPEYKNMAEEDKKYCPHCKNRIYRTGVIPRQEIGLVWFGKCNCEQSIQTREQEADLEKRKEQYYKNLHDKKRKSKILESSNIVGNMLEVKLDDYKTITKTEELNKNKARWYIDNFNHSDKKGLFIVGDTGTGKTILALAISNELLQRDKEVIYLSNADFKSNLNSYNNKDKAQELKKKCLSSDLLVIDDLGTEKPTEAYICNLIHIIDKRLQQGKNIIVTTNYGSSELINRLSYDSNITGKKILNRLTSKLEILKAS